MVTVTFDEAEFNEVTAGLDMRVRAMSLQLCTLKEQRDSPDNRFAIEATQAAIRSALRAQLTIASSLPEPMEPARIERMMGVWGGIEQYQAEGR